jgi:HD-GYP domain-containing protein (c-di-GMP phosphodiesterase class II)
MAIEKRKNRAEKRQGLPNINADILDAMDGGALAAALRKASALDKLVSLYKDASQTSITDLNYVLDRGLSEAMSFFGADAGTIYVYENHREKGPILRFGYIKNSTLKIDAFNYNYSNKVIPVNRLSIAGCVADTRTVLSIPNVYELKGDLLFNRDFDKSSGYRSVSMLVAPLFGYVGNFIGVIQLINKKTDRGIVPFSHVDSLCIEILSRHAGGALDKALTARNHTLNMIKVATTFDPGETGAHAQRVTDIGMEIAMQMSVSLYTDLRLREPFAHGLTLHDIGKIGIPAIILQKPGKLTDEEFATVKRHPGIGHAYFSGMEAPFNSIPAEIALYHHEKWDGTGYPNGASYKRIPLSGRIAAVADVVEALSSNRSYKKAWPFDKVCELISKGRGKQFDPDVVDAFFAAKDRIYGILVRDRPEKAAGARD